MLVGSCGGSTPSACMSRRSATTRSSSSLAWSRCRSLSETTRSTCWNVDSAWAMSPVRAAWRVSSIWSRSSRLSTEYASRRVRRAFVRFCQSSKPATIRFWAIRSIPRTASAHGSGFHERPCGFFGPRREPGDLNPERFGALGPLGDPREPTRELGGERIPRRGRAASRRRLRRRPRPGQGSIGAGGGLLRVGREGRGGWRGRGSGVALLPLGVRSRLCPRALGEESGEVQRSVAGRADKHILGEGRPAVGTNEGRVGHQRTR